MMIIGDEPALNYWKSELHTRNYYIEDVVCSADFIPCNMLTYASTICDVLLPRTTFEACGKNVNVYTFSWFWTIEPWLFTFHHVSKLDTINKISRQQDSRI